MAARTRRLTVTLRRMRLSDIPQVMAIDRLCFPTPWPAHSYQYELTRSHNSRMFTLSLPQERTQTESRPFAWLDRLRYGPPTPETIVGYSGLWSVVDETHISTIGVHPDWQGLHLGELLLFAMLRRSIQMNARVTTLEVRVSNEVAISLYHKYGFEIVNRRKSYYRDNREDAWLMSVDLSDAAYRERLRELGTALYQQLDVTDKRP